MSQDQNVKLSQKRIGAKWAKKEERLVYRRVLKGCKDVVEKSKPLTLK